MSLRPHRIGRRAVTALLLSLTLISGAAPVAAVPPPGAANARVITTWNEIAVNTVTNNGAAASPTSFNYFAFVHLAMYNAVVGITGEYELYHWDKHAPTGASPEAAAAAAAHRVLSNYFPGAAANLDAQLAASLALVPDGGAQDKAISYGVRAADNIIALRMNDGRNALVDVPVADAPGEWRHRVAAPADRAPALGHEHLPLADAQRGHAAALARVDGEADIAGAQHDAVDGVAFRHRATVTAWPSRGDRHRAIPGRHGTQVSTRSPSRAIVAN